ncbi:MAG: DUF1684 domain-containing protein [Phycisphaerae bacterium]|nr:DUF1684 domain-containing protein [Phycisphaerae bacterium]
MFFRMAALLLTLACSVAGCASTPPTHRATDMSSAINDWNTWHEQRLRRLQADDGWLTLVDLAFVTDGVWSMGRSDANRLRYEHATAERVGAFVVHEDRVVFACDVIADGPSSGHPVAEVTADGRVIDTVELIADDKGTPTVLRNGPLSFTLVRRNGALALRVRDNASGTRATFTGIDRFPYDEALVLTAGVEPAAASATVSITNVQGFVEDQPLAATLVFDVCGTQAHLAATAGASGGFFVVFGDATNGSTSYGGGRFLEVAPPVDGTVTLDFNRAYNPPCSFTDFATCPLPPAANRLACRVEAGERHP